MILAGVFKQNNNSFEKLISVVGDHIKKDITYFNHPLVDIIIGRTSNTLEQGEILMNPNNLLVGKVFKKSNFKPLNLNDLDAESLKQKNGRGNTA